MQKLKLLPFYRSGSGAEYHRVQLPALYMQREGYLENEMYQGMTVENVLDYVKQSEIVIWNRACPIDLDLMTAMREVHGFKIVVDLDDWIELPTFNPHYEQYKKITGPAILKALEIADLVTTTTERLRKKIHRYNPMTLVFPNTIPFDYGQFQCPPIEKHETFDFIYAGASSHLEDVRLLQDALHKMKDVPGVSLTMAGYQGNKTVLAPVGSPIVSMKNISRAKINEQMDAILNVMRPRYTRLDFAPVDEYMKSYDRSHCSLVPLKTDYFNYHKSNLKLLEAAAKKIPCIVSAVPPYTDNDCGEPAPVYWVKQPRDWIEHMSNCVRYPNVAKEDGTKLYQWAFKYYNMKSWAPVRYDIYKKLIDGLPIFE